uniref:Type III modification methylase n=1 Tax=Endomicrobium trichonymphae TaxID=1408204 RepID=A0A1C9ZTC1_ENDTX|nr:type III modification methylase [Candidatus Endomicrobium trichonymphae]
MQNINEAKFYQALENIFTGAKIEGDSGYINLLKIKSSYYKLILEQFKKDVNAESGIIKDSFKEEFFDKLYSFFERYFSESGSVYFVKTTNWQRVYEQVYTDNKDVILFWKTHMLYYVKSDILFQDISTEILDEQNGLAYNFHFYVGTLKNKQNNEKKNLFFDFFKEEISEKDGKKTYIFNVNYSEGGKKTKTSEISRELKIKEDVLEKAFTVFKKQSEVDFFINKNANAFLNEQLDLYLHQILLNTENKFDQERLDQLKTIKVFAKKIISFIAQFEDELVRIWNKPKFVLNSNYVITLDKLTDEIIDRLSKHSNLKEQIKEWQELGMVDNNFSFSERSGAHKYLPIDTKHFKNLELDILTLFDNLDEALDGRLIHSENYQALNTLQEKYKEKIQCIYIDPPFNLDKNASFDYKVNYKDAIWATILENRLKIAKNFLKDTGSIFVRSDYNGNFIVRCLLDNVFGKENFRNEFIVNTTQKFFEGSQRYNIATNSLFWYSKQEKDFYFKIQTKRRIEKKWMEAHSGGERRPPERIILGEKVYPPKGRHWTFIQEKINIMEKEERIRWKEKEYMDYNGEKQYKIAEYLWADEKFLNSNWTDISGYSSTTGFQTENSELLLQRSELTASKKNDIVLDFFMGSATTQVVAQKLSRKWLGIEMSEQFFKVNIPRLKRVMSGIQQGISKELKEKYNGSGFFKYYSLEQYENTLRNMKYSNNTPSTLWDNKNPFETYIFKADQKFADVLGIESEILEVDFDKLYKDIDFAETISNLKGLPIKRITKTSVLLDSESKEIKTDYKNMTNSEKIEFIRLLKPLLWWGE